MLPPKQLKFSDHINTKHPIASAATANEDISNLACSSSPNYTGGEHPAYEQFDVLTYSTVIYGFVLFILLSEAQEKQQVQLSILVLLRKVFLLFFDVRFTKEHIPICSSDTIM